MVPVTGFTVVSIVGSCSYNVHVTWFTVASNVGSRSYNLPVTGFTVVSNVGRCSYNVPVTGYTVVSNVGRRSYNVAATAVFTTNFKFSQKNSCSGTRRTHVTKWKDELRQSQLILMLHYLTSMRRVST